VVDREAMLMVATWFLRLSVAMGFPTGGSGSVWPMGATWSTWRRMGSVAALRRVRGQACGTTGRIDPLTTLRLTPLSGP
jgi:hypothetical protein